MTQCKYSLKLPTRLLKIVFVGRGKDCVSVIRHHVDLSSSLMYDMFNRIMSTLSDNTHGSLFSSTLWQLGCSEVEKGDSKLKIFPCVFRVFCLFRCPLNAMVVSYMVSIFFIIYHLSATIFSSQFAYVDSWEETRKFRISTDINWHA